MTECEHFNFRCTTSVNRLSKEVDGPIISFTADICIACADCGLPFRFVGLKFGSSQHHPTGSADSLELRAPIEPELVKEFFGKPTVSGTC